jgi:hypothetical protein
MDQLPFELNQVFRDITRPENEISRLVFVAEGHAFLFRMAPKLGWPKPMLLAELTDLVDRGQWVLTKFESGKPYNFEDAKAEDPKEGDLISLDAQRIRNERYTALEDLVTHATQYRLLFLRDASPIQEAIGKHGHDRAYYYTNLKRWYLHGGILNALLPTTWRCGAPGKAKSHTGAKLGRQRMEVKTNHAPEKTGINSGAYVHLIGQLFATKWDDKMTMSRFTDLVNEAAFGKQTLDVNGESVVFYGPDQQLLTKGEVEYRVNQLKSRAEVIRKGSTPHIFNLKMRGLGGSIRDSLWYPTQRYEIDSTVLDLWLVSVYNRAWLIGRPIVYFVVDVDTRMIAGFHIALHGPDAKGALMACFNAFSEKAAFLQRVGINQAVLDRLGLTGEWPCHYLPQNLVSDRGEMLTEAVKKAMFGTTVNQQILPACRGDLKAHVERMFRTSNDKFVHWIAGAVRQRLRDRGDSDPRDGACLNLHELWKAMTIFVLVYNETTDASKHACAEALQDGVERLTPLELWNWGLVNAEGAPRRLPMSDLIRRFLPEEQAVVGREGILLGEVRYRSDTAIKQEWTTVARSDGSWPIKVRADASPGAGIYWMNPATGQYELFSRDDSRVPAEATEWDVKDKKQYLTMTARDNKNARSGTGAAAREEIGAMVENAKTEAKAARDGLSKAEQYSNVRENRRHEQAALDGPGLVPAAREADSAFDDGADEYARFLSPDEERRAA